MSQIESKYRATGRTTNMIGAIRDELQSGGKAVVYIPLPLENTIQQELGKYIVEGKLVVRVLPSLNVERSSLGIDFETMQVIGTGENLDGHKLFVDHSIISAIYGKMIDQYFNMY